VAGVGFGAYALKTYNATFTYTIKPIAMGTWSSGSYSLGQLLAGNSGAKTFTDSLSVTVHKSGTVTTHFKIEGNLTALAEDFTSLNVRIFNSGGTRATLTLTSPEATYGIPGPQTMTFSVEVIYSVDVDAEDMSDSFDVSVWFTAS